MAAGDPYSYDEIVNRDKVNLDLFWLRDASLEESADLPEPHVLAREIADDLRSALNQMGKDPERPGARFAAALMLTVARRRGHRPLIRGWRRWRRRRRRWGRLRQRWDVPTERRRIGRSGR